MDIDIQKYKGRTLTCSWISNVSDDCDITFLIYTFNSSSNISIKSGINKYSSELNYEKHKISFTIPIDLENSCKMLVIRPIRYANKNDITINITNIKLELGTISTPFVSKSYEEELSSCQRYYIGGELIGIPFFIQQNYIRFAFSIPTTMKNTPTLINEDFFVTAEDENNGLRLIDNEQQNVDGFTINDIYLKNNVITVGVYKENHGLTGLPILIIRGNNGFSSEIFY